MKRKSKRELVLDIYDNEAMGEVTAREIAVINTALIEEYGEGGAMTPAEIARILHDEDLPVRFDQVFRMMTTTEKYENAFARFLENDDSRTRRNRFEGSTSCTGNSCRRAIGRACASRSKPPAPPCRTRPSFRNCPISRRRSAENRPRSPSGSLSGCKRPTSSPNG